LTHHKDLENVEIKSPCDCHESAYFFTYVAIATVKILTLKGLERLRSRYRIRTAFATARCLLTEKWSFVVFIFFGIHRCYLFGLSTNNDV